MNLERDSEYLVSKERFFAIDLLRELKTDTNTRRSNIGDPKPLQTPANSSELIGSSILLTEQSVRRTSVHTREYSFFGRYWAST
jgi:hypothetical protein